MIRTATFGLSLLLVAFGADNAHAGDIEVANTWSRALPPMSSNGAVYFTIKNSGKLPDRLLGGSTAMAERAELHTHEMEGDLMHMRRVPSIEVNPGDKRVLQPGEMHMMMIGLKGPLKAGERFPMMLEFERAGMIHVEVEVLAADASGPMHSGHGQHAGKHKQGAHAHGHQTLMEMDAASAPSLEMSLEPLDGGAWHLHLETARFQFSEEHADQPHVAGEGHAHLYINGKKIGRLYGSPSRIDALPPGLHEIKVGLYTNDHAAYASGGREIAERFVVLVQKLALRATAGARRFEISISNDSVGDENKRIQVTEGETVELRFTSDAPQMLHLYGYDIRATLTPESPVTVQFVASETGQFPIKSHGQTHGHAGGHSHGAGHEYGHGALMHLEVSPR